MRLFQKSISLTVCLCWLTPNKVCSWNLIVINSPMKNLRNTRQTIMMNMIKHVIIKFFISSLSHLAYQLVLFQMLTVCRLVYFDYGLWNCTSAALRWAVVRFRKHPANLHCPLTSVSSVIDRQPSSEPFTENYISNQDYIGREIRKINKNAGVSEMFQNSSFGTGLFGT